MTRTRTALPIALMTLALDALCDTLADPARLDSVSATGEAGVPDGDSRVTCPATD